LLDECGNLKLSDFGLATVYKHKNKTRILTTPCGTPPYLAPEIRNLSYHGDRVDVWSSGIILYVLLVGNTAWAEPTLNDEEYLMYSQNYPSNLGFYPWNSFSPFVLELLLGILNINDDSRFTIDQIRDSSWFKIPNLFLDTNGMCKDPSALAERLKSKLETFKDSASQSMAYSQPTDLRLERSPEVDKFKTSPQYFSFSQPVAQQHQTQESFEREMGISSTQFSKKGLFVDLFPSSNITRFFSHCSSEIVLTRLAEAFEQYLIPCKIIDSSKLAFTTVDKRRCQLHGEVTIQPAGSANLVSFSKRKVLIIIT
jgi:serine/threonine-protein kinase Chk1